MSLQGASGGMVFLRRAWLGSWQTNGAFYPHFESKEALLRETLANMLADRRAQLEENCGLGSDIRCTCRGRAEIADLVQPSRHVPR
jgi:TetR/AcrR family transcriptional repressor of nem operon